MCSEIQNSVKILLTMAHDELSPISSCSFIPDAITLLQTIIIYHLNFRNTSCLGSEFSHFFSPIRFFFFSFYIIVIVQYLKQNTVTTLLQILLMFSFLGKSSNFLLFLVIISLLCFCLLSVFISYTPYSRDIEVMSFP